jgi:RNA polymerase-interacting CarD/CdnL/TRCF family regulator
VHGAGVVTGERKYVIDGRENHYLCIDLQDTANSRVMVPINLLDDAGLREAIGNIGLVREIMFNEPRKLDDHYRTRQANIRERIDEGGIRQLVQGLRDLCWREHYDRLTNTDKKLRSRLQKRLQRELSVAHNLSKSAAREWVNQIIDEAMQMHTQNLGSELDD